MTTKSQIKAVVGARIGEKLVVRPIPPLPWPIPRPPLPLPILEKVCSSLLARLLK
jgi:hypothetical protein